VFVEKEKKTLAGVSNHCEIIFAHYLQQAATKRRRKRRTLAVNKGVA